MRDKRPQLLVVVSTLTETVFTEAVAGHYCHILQVTVTALFTYRTVVRVVGHQPLDHAFTELFGFCVIDGNKGSIGCRCHTRHHQTATRIFRVLVLLYRTLAASADASQRRMPAKVRNIEAERETSLQQVVSSIYVVFFAVYMNRSHSQHASKWPALRQALIKNSGRVVGASRLTSVASAGCSAECRQSHARY
ncbi:hypothetical protein D3C80_1372470 [compost metagenome]